MMHGGMMRQIAEKEEEKAKNTTLVAWRLIRLLKPYWKVVTVSFVMILIGAATQGVGPYLIGLAIDQFIAGKDLPNLLWTSAALAGTFVVGMFATRYQIYTMSLATQKLLADLRRSVFEKVQALDLKYVESKQAGDLMSRLVNDIEAINSFISQSLTQMLGALFALVGIMIAMFLLDWRMALASLSVVPVMFVMTKFFSSLARTAFRKTRTTIGDVSAEMEEQISGVKVAQAFNRTEVNVRQFSERNAANRNANVSANAVTSAFGPAMELLSTIDTALVAALGGYLAIMGLMTVGTVVAFIQYVQNFFRPIATVSQMWTLAQSAFAAAERVFELLDTPQTITDAPDAQALPRIDGRVQFEGVSFGYDDNRLILKDVSLDAAPGQTIALVGPTGAGKTTAIGLLTRFYEVSSGAIRVDGHDLRDVTQLSLRSQMGMVTQDPFLFSGTIMDNIRYGRLAASDEEVIAAAQAANAHSFIERLPNGYQTEVGERGGMLSQGQRQLIAIARAVLADPRILILDEATASIDTRTEKLIQSALNTLLKGRTSFVIAHRLSTVRNADQVLVIDDGQIVERGAHADLLAQNGLYAELYNRQFYTPPESQISAA
ncbi:MAG TPA: ABC transporter ATP-binding protein [Anaerolineae bacterium]|jgi:ATP-binding cassette subfamily B protein/subfamily B ATP-binding cassette protein MsbA|nr:ABC transporter ATP-binding protein [Anaerolineae bacterium]